MLFLQLLTGSQPKCAFRLGGHAPVAPGAESNGANLDPVRHAVAFELLVEKAPVEVFQPLAQGIIIKVIGKGQLRQLEYLLRLQPKAYHIIQEEVMQGIGAYQVFGLLGDVAFFIRGKQLGADGCIQSALQHSREAAKAGFSMHV